MRRIASGGALGALGVVTMGSVVGGAGVAQAEQSIDVAGTTVSVPDSCDVYLRSGLAQSFPDTSHTQRCLTEKGLTGSGTAGSTSPMSGTSSSTSTSSGGSSTTTTTTAPAPASSGAPATTPAASSAPAAPVRTKSGATSDDPDDEPAAPGETKSVPIG